MPKNINPKKARELAKQLARETNLNVRIHIEAMPYPGGDDIDDSVKLVAQRVRELAEELARLTNLNVRISNESIAYPGGDDVARNLISDTANLLSGTPGAKRQDTVISVQVDAFSDLKQPKLKDAKDNSEPDKNSG